MKANENYISLETGKLLKDCGLESEWYFNKYKARDFNLDNIDKSKYADNKQDWECYPAFTWWEILWKYPKQLLGSKRSGFNEGVLDRNFYTLYILRFLQQEQYDQADQYFREHCILINNKGE